MRKLALELNKILSYFPLIGPKSPSARPLKFLVNLTCQMSIQSNMYWSTWSTFATCPTCSNLVSILVSGVQSHLAHFSVVNCKTTLITFTVSPHDLTETHYSSTFSKPSKFTVLRKMKKIPLY